MTSATPAGSLPERLVAQLMRGLGAVVMTLLCLLAGVVLWQVISRYLIGRPSVATEDLVQIFLPWFGLLGAAWTFGEGRQLAVEFLSTRVEGRTAVVVAVLVQALTFTFATVVMVWGGAGYALTRLGHHEATEILAFPVGFIYMAVPVSGACIALVAVADTVAALAGRTPTHRPAAEDM